MPVPKGKKSSLSDIYQKIVITVRRRPVHSTRPPASALVHGIGRPTLHKAKVIAVSRPAGRIDRLRQLRPGVLKHQPYRDHGREPLGRAALDRGGGGGLSGRLGAHKNPHLGNA